MLLIYLTLKETPSVPCRKCQPPRGNERSPKLSYATKFNFSRKKLVDYFKISSQMEAPPPLFFSEQNEQFLRITWHFDLFLFFFQNVDIRSRRRNLFWFYVKMHKIQNYSWWSDSKTKITNYWSFSLVKRKIPLKTFKLLKEERGRGRPRRRPLFRVIGKSKNSTFLISRGVFLFFCSMKNHSFFWRRFRISTRKYGASL